jgi:hypothetical protein
MSYVISASEIPVGVGARRRGSGGGMSQPSTLTTWHALTAAGHCGWHIYRAVNYLRRSICRFAWNPRVASVMIMAEFISLAVKSG